MEKEKNIVWRFLKHLIDRMNRFDDLVIGKIMNYPSKGIIPLIFMISFLALVYSFSTYSLVFGLTREITIPEIPFLVIFYILPIIAVFLYCHKFVYKSIRYYEQTYGKTELGDEYIER